MPGWQIVDADYDKLLGKFKDLTEAEAADFLKIINLLDSKETVQGYLDILISEMVAEKVVVANAVGTSEDCLMAELDDDEQWGEALHLVLRKQEDKHGFDEKKVFWLEGLLGTDDFLAMMANKIVFMDPFVTANHGAQTHRIQWWMISKAMDASSPSAWDAESASDLYLLANRARFGPGTEDTLWYLVFDAQREKTARCPEFLTPYIKKYNESGFFKKAEEVALDWGTTPKGRIENLKLVKRRNFIFKQPTMCEVTFKAKA